MKRNSTKILLLAGVFIIIGLAFTLFAGTSSEKKAASETAKPETGIDLAQKTERDLFAKNLDKLKEITEKLDKKDLNKFKEQTRDGVLLLTDLINELPKVTGERPNNVLEKTLQAKNNAEKIVLLDNKNQIIRQIKNSFENAAEAIKEIKDSLNCKEKIAKIFCDKVEKHLDKIEKINKKINGKNYKEKTKKIFTHFHSLLKYMDKEMSKPEFLTFKRQQVNDREVNPIIRAEQNVSKLEKKEEVKPQMQKEDSKCKEKCKKEQKQEKEQKKESKPEQNQEHKK